MAGIFSRRFNSAQIPPLPTITGTPGEGFAVKDALVALLADHADFQELSRMVPTWAPASSVPLSPPRRIVSMSR